MIFNSVSVWLTTQRMYHLAQLIQSCANCTCQSSLCLHLGQSTIHVPQLLYFLESYDRQEDAQILADGFQNGFKIEYVGPRNSLLCRNLKSAFDNETVLMEKINTELTLKRFAGPFTRPPFPNLRTSPLCLVPKSDGGWRMITHLSYPEGGSVNDGIDKSFTSVQYTSFDQVTNMIYTLGPSALIAKRDLKSAYRLIPIRPLDFPLLGMKVGDN